MTIMCGIKLMEKSDNHGHSFNFSNHTITDG